MVFVNERYVGLSPARLIALTPGRYRIYIQRPGEPGRLHMASVGQGKRVLTLDYRLDRVLQTEPNVLLLYPTESALQASRQHDARAIARRLRADQVLLLGIRRYQGRRMLEGSLLSATSAQVIRSGLLALEPTSPSPAAIKSFGAYLLEGTPSSDVVAYGSSDAAKHSALGVWSWITLGVGAATLAAGIPLIALHNSGTCRNTNCPETYNTLGPGLGLTIAGGAVLASSALLFVMYLNRDRPAAKASLSAAPSAQLAPWFTARNAGLSVIASF